MHRLFRTAFIIWLVATGSYRAAASHIYGADFFYSHISGNDYQIKLVLYGDCGGASFSNLSTATPQVTVYDADTLWQLFYLDDPESQNGTEVSQVCSGQLQNTTCNNPGGTIPGVKQFVYSKIITLPHTSANWKFRFTGTLNDGATALAGRSNSITNIAGVTGSRLAMEAELNNTASGNSTPQFTTIPTPFSCINTYQQYNQGAVDANGDSLGYSLISALEGDPSPGYVNYVAGYSATHPILTEAGTFSFSATTGQLNFTPASVQRSVVVNKVTEYRNGIKVGSAMREMTFIVLGDCNNEAPTANLNQVMNLYGGVVDSSGNLINACNESSQLSFDLNAGDVDGDSIVVSFSGLPAGSTLVVENNNSHNPLLHFTWPVSGIPYGAYTFFVTFKDNGCPLSSQQTKAFTINVVAPPSVSIAMLSPTDCFHQAAVAYTFIGSTPPYQVSVAQNGEIVRSFTANSNSVTDSLPSGLSNITVSLGGQGCDTMVTYVVNDNGTYPYGPATDDSVFYCTGDAAAELTATNASGGSISWYSATGTALGSAPVPSTTVPGETIYLVSQMYGNCESVMDTVHVFVNEKPTAVFSLPLDNVCSGEALAVITGAPEAGDTYSFEWSGADSVAPVANGYWVSWDTGGLKIISLTVTKNGCLSNPYTDTVTVRQTPAADFSVTDACAGMPAVIIYNLAPYAGQNFAWTFSNQQPAQSTAQGPFSLVWSTPGDEEVSLITGANGCTDSARKTIHIYPNPGAPATLTGGSACLGDVVQLPADSGATYVWEPAELIFTNPDGSLFTRIIQPATYTVIATNVYGCKAADTVTYTEVIPCCTFSYPTAFTPNGDGRNDRFRPILYGNPSYYDLKIFNRWGQLVYQTTDPKAGWDGQNQGTTSAAGVYFYRMNAKCLTGRLEDQSGDVTLVR